MANLEEILQQAVYNGMLPYKIAGENLIADLLRTEEQWTPNSLSVNATLTILPSVTSGVLGQVTIAQMSCPTLTAYDNPSGASGTILFHADAGNHFTTYLPKASFGSGLTFWVTGGNSIRVPFGYRS